MQPTIIQILKAIIFTFIFGVVFNIHSFWLLVAVGMFLIYIIPIWDKEEKEFQKDIKEGNDLKKWYTRFPYRAPNHQGKQEIQKWLNRH